MSNLIRVYVVVFFLFINVNASPPMMQPIENVVVDDVQVNIKKQGVAEPKELNTTEDSIHEYEDINYNISLVQKAFNKEESEVGIKTVTDSYYHKNKIYKVKIREAMTSTIILPQSETIKNLILGDESSFITEKLEDNIFIIFPTRINRDSSVTVITDKRIYPFYIKSISFETEELPDLVLRINDYNYQKITHNIIDSKSIIQVKPPVATKKDEDIDFLEEAELNPENINWNYKMKGSKNIAPNRVWNDGNFTYLDFSDKSVKKRAVLAYKVIDKVDSPVNVRWKGEILIVETIGDLTLKNGKEYTCIKLNS